jgi:hypothetical protein
VCEVKNQTRNGTGYERERRDEKREERKEKEKHRRRGEA